MSFSRELAIAEGKALRDARLAARMTLRELGFHLGVTVQYLSDVENGRRRLSEERARQADDALGVHVVTRCESCGHRIAGPVPSLSRTVPNPSNEPE